jgi:hypothetical protein
MYPVHLRLSSHLHLDQNTAVAFAGGYATISAYDTGLAT